MKPVVLEIGCGHFSDFQIWRSVKTLAWLWGKKNLVPPRQPSDRAPAAGSLSATTLTKRPVGLGEKWRFFIGCVMGDMMGYGSLLK
jgi:hypothetical protein